MICWNVPVSTGIFYTNIPRNRCAWCSDSLFSSKCGLLLLPSGPDLMLIVESLAFWDISHYMKIIIFTISIPWKETCSPRRWAPWQCRSAPASLAAGRWRASSSGAGPSGWELWTAEEQLEPPLTAICTHTAHKDPWHLLTALYHK